MACDHNWVWDSETKTTVTHRCTKCRDTYTQSKHHRFFAFAATALMTAFAVAMLLLVLAYVFSGAAASGGRSS